MDVMEMTRKLEGCIYDVLVDNDHKLAMSALISASINCMLEQCDNLEEVVFYRDIFMHLLDISIQRIQFKEPD